MPTVFRHLSVFLIALGFLTPQAQAQITIGPGGASAVQAELLLSHDQAAPGDAVTVGVKLTIDEGWHVYWTNPAGPGFPPSVNWTLPEGYEISELRWPAPHRFTFAGATQYGYEHEVILLADLVVPADAAVGENVVITAAVSWLACEESCIPGNAQPMARLAVGETLGPATDDASAILATEHDVPLTVQGWTITAESDGPNFQLRLTGPDAEALEALEAAEDVHFYSSTQDVIDPNTPQVLERDGQTLLLKLSLQTVDAFGNTLERDEAVTQLAGVLVAHGASFDAGGRHHAILVDQPVAAGQGASADGEDAAGASSYNVPVLLVSAFIGGLILNLMPCVFPVLSIKILGFVQQAGEDKVIVRRHGYAFGIGVLASFWVLAGALLLLRQGGEQLGWGFQLQDPRFVLFMVFLIFAIGLNLSGVFEIGMGATALAGKVEQGSSEGYTKSFLSGVLATLIATPCTAPFMGAAIGAALTIPPIQSLLIFTSVGAGMATPYVLLSCFPGLLRFMPRPGPWMETFKQSMAFPMFATAAWLAWVFVTITDEKKVAMLGIGLTLFAMGAWAYGRWSTPMHKPRARWIARVAAIALAASAVFVSLYDRNTEVTWEPFSEARLAELRKTGQPIFVDFTASWCISCQANKRSSLRTAEADALFLEHDVVLMEADWSKRDDTTLRVLQEYGRAGVPLYLMFPADPDAEPQILPNLLTPGIVRDAVEHAAEG